MNEVNEKMQLMIFDLLEGNLNSKQSAEALKHIQENQDLLDFYKSMQTTYLQPETILFPNKTSLLKAQPSKLKVWMWTGAAAASVALVVYFAQVDPIHPNRTIANQTIPKSAGKTHSATAVIEPRITIDKVVPNIVLEMDHHSTKKMNVYSKKRQLPMTAKSESNQITKSSTVDSALQSRIEKNKFVAIEKSETPKPLIQTPEVAFANYTVNGKNSTYEGEQKALKTTWLKEIFQLIKEGNLPEIKFRKSSAVSATNSDIKLMVCTENAAYNSYIYSENE